ncbi:hypothetical protein IAT38_005056 [Cryptococcus sp. DSM 104549]
MRSFAAPSRALRAATTSARARYLHSSPVWRDDKALKELYAKFQDPSSHYHIPAGTDGPEHEDDHSSSRVPTPPSTSSPAGTGARAQPNDRPWLKDEAARRAKALEFFREQGHDTVGVLTWPVAWGDQDSFQHVNNVKILQWFESARIRYAESLVDDLGEETVSNMLRAKGTGIILKDVSIKYKAPITYPDIVMVSSCIHSIKQDRASYGMKHFVWSLKDQQVKAISDSTTVMYDYDNLKKGVMSDHYKELLERVVASYGK